MKKYIRNTHDFNNTTRRWEFKESCSDLTRTLLIQTLEFQIHDFNRESWSSKTNIISEKAYNEIYTCDVGPYSNHDKLEEEYNYRIKDLDKIFDEEIEYFIKAGVVLECEE